MLFFRILLILTALATAAGVVGFLLSGERRYLRWAFKALLAGLAAGLVFFAILIAERLA